MTPKITQFIFTASLLLFSMESVATLVYEKGDWGLHEQNTSAGIQCLASNEDSSWFRSETYYLEITKLKNKLNTPAEFILRVKDNDRKNAGFTATLKGSAVPFVFSPLNGNQSLQIFAGIGSNLSQFIELLKANRDDIEIKGIGGSSTVEFSNDGDGFKEVIAEMQKRCNKGAKIADAKFEAYFFNSLPKNLNPLKISQQKNQQLRTIYFAAYDLFTQGKTAQAELDAIIAKYLPAMKELETVKNELNQTQNVDLPNTQQTLANAQKQQVTSQAEITRLETLIPQLQSKVTQSQQAYDAVYAILAPHIPEYNRLSDNLSNARTSLRDAKNRYDYINDRLGQISNRLSALRSEESQLSSSLPSQRSNLSDLSSSLREAESRRYQFNVSSEIDRQIDRNSEHQQLHNERQRLNSHLADAERDVSNIRGERERVQRALDQCKATTPPTDCSRFESALTEANTQLNEKERVKIEIGRKFNEISSRLSDIERSIERDVRNQYDQLVRREEEIRSEHDRVERIVRNNEDRLAQIRISERPQLEQEESRLLSEKPQVSAQIRDFTNIVNQAEADLEKFEAATDWQRKADNVVKAENKLSADKNQLSLAIANKKSEENKLQNALTVEQQSKERITLLQNKIAQLNKRISELEESIKPLAEERAPLDRRIEAFKTKLTEYKENYLAILR